MKRILSFFLVLTILFGSAGCADEEPLETSISGQEENFDPANYNIISIEDYLDKTTSGLLAQFVGFLSGYEFARNSDGTPRVAMPDSWFEICNGPYAEPNSRNKHEDKLLMNEETGLWEVWNDDDYSIDILNQYILADMYAEYGTFSSKVIKDGWVKYDVYDMGGGHRTYGAYGLMSKRGYLPVFSGSAEFGNKYSVNGEPYIGNETLGMDAAGMPNVAADLSEVFGRVTSDCDPVIWLKFFATMYAMAYFEDDIPTLIREAEKVLPEGCWQREIIAEVFALKERYPDDWRRAVVNAERNCFRSHYDQDSTMGETSINCSFILIGLLYGDGDYYETCKIISLAGHGGDSTTPVGLGIVGIINGMKDLPPEVNEKVWQDGKGVVVNLPRATKEAYYMYCAGLPERIPMTDIVEMYQKNFESILLENGGKIADGNYYIPKNALAVPDTVLVEDFEDGNLDGYSSFGDGTLLGDFAFTGNYAVKVNGNESADSGVYKTLSGLKVGSTYRMTAYVSTAARTTARLFARASGASDYTFATVYDQQAFAKRDFLFTATAESMEVGLLVPAGTSSHKYAVMDDITIVRVEENKPLGDDAVSIKSQAADGKYTKEIAFEVQGKADREVYLKLTFSNTCGKMVDASILLNGKEYASVPFYKTGSDVMTNGCDFIYIPVILNEDVNTISFNIGSNALYISAAEIVTVTDRW